MFGFRETFGAAVIRMDHHGVREGRCFVDAIDHASSGNPFRLSALVMHFAEWLSWWNRRKKIAVQRRCTVSLAFRRCWRLVRGSEITLGYGDDRYGDGAS